jgi:hypothetical protein
MDFIVQTARPCISPFYSTTPFVLRKFPPGWGKRFDGRLLRKRLAGTKSTEKSSTLFRLLETLNPELYFTHNEVNRWDLTLKLFERGSIPK